MSRVKKQHGGGYEIWTPSGSTSEPASSGSDDVLLLGRQVEGSSIVDLNDSTHGLGKRTPRVLDVFYMGMVYAGRLKEARADSPLEDPPSVDELAERFERLDLASLHEPVVADVLGARSHRGEVAVYVDYPAFHEEQAIMGRAVTSEKYLKLPRLHSVVPNDPRIVIVEGQLSRDEQISQIESALPDQINLSAIKPVPQS